MALSTQRQEQPGSPPMGRPQQAEKVGGAAGGRPGIPGPTRLVQVHPLLAEIVDQIADWDFPDGGVARALRTKALPSTAAYLIAQYRLPIGTDHHFGSSGYRQRRYVHVATMVRTGVATLRASGPPRVLILPPHPGAPARLLCRRMQDFPEEKVEAGKPFQAGD